MAWLGAWTIRKGLSEGFIIATTLAEQLASVQAAIAAIERGAQSSSNDGDSLMRADLKVLYDREEKLLNKKARGDRGNISVAEFG